jgi:hypothetical protein
MPKAGYLVGQVFHQTRCTVYAYHLAVIISANVERAALRICKAANLFQVFVPSTAFVFYILSL